MSRVMRQYSDACAIALPRTASPMVDGVLIVPLAREVTKRLSDVAEERLKADYPRSRMVSVTWTLCYTVDDVDAWELPHICPDCLECKDRSVKILNEQPDMFIALGHLICEERVYP